MNVPTNPPRPPQVPLDQVSAEDVRRVLRRVVRKHPVPVAVFGSAI